MCALLAVPKQLLEEVGPDTSDPFLLSDYMHGTVRGRVCQKLCVHTWVNQAFLGLSVPMVPTTGTCLAAPPSITVPWLTPPTSQCPHLSSWRDVVTGS